MLSQVVVGALSEGPSIHISMMELGIVSGLVAVLFMVLKWTTNRFLVGTVDKLTEHLATTDEKVNRLERDMLTSAAELRASLMSKEDMIKVLAEVNKRLDRTTDVSERLQIAVAELTLLIKETREELKDSRKE